MDDRALIRSLEGVHNKRFLAFTALALLISALVLGRMVVGFRGSDVSKGADAMARVGYPAAQAPLTPPPLLVP
jgi:hypothetical protein